MDSQQYKVPGKPIWQGQDTQQGAEIAHSRDALKKQIKREEIFRQQTKEDYQLDYVTGTGEYKISPKKDSAEITSIDDRDIGTPDCWVPRHPELIRLTGRHPLNAEPPMNALIDLGFITTNQLHYVRNHGSVPKLDWNTHTLEISGLVDTPKVFSMEELISLDSINIPVTICCDGNRRKELNMIKHTNGFNWGPAAVGTAVWKGVPLRLLLKECGIQLNGAKYVCFEGADTLWKGKYGTSIPVATAMDPLNDIIVAYEMNNCPIPPDHGYPIRLVIPGFVGGRMVKWLSKIEISKEESKSHYHWHDNKALPPNLFLDTPYGAECLRNPDYTIYELNINSVIVHPGHDEFIALSDTGCTLPYTLRGYAYTGGGRKITRVEVSFDNGGNWELCEHSFPRDEIRNGSKCWMWCHWKLDVDAWRFLTASNIVVRAVDSSINTQPDKPTWNALGMMNNSWYRVQIEIQTNGHTPAMIFKHPVQQGSMLGGWMETPMHAVRHPLCSCKADIKTFRQITMEEVQKHNTEEDCWIVVNGDVLDLTSYLIDHPGGMAPILVHAGGDATEQFRQIHADDAWEIAGRYVIGTLVERVIPVQPLPQRDETIALNPRRWTTVTLKHKENVSHDTRRFTFELPPSTKKMGLPVGQHILLGTDIEEHLIVRPYTPISPIGTEDDQRCFELVVKIYFAGKSNVFPQRGVMTQYLEGLKLGETVKIKGPAGPVVYRGRGSFIVHGNTVFAKQVSMVAGGTGITPMFQLAKAITNDPSDTTQIRLIYANHTEHDILLREELEDLTKNYHNFQVWHTVSKPSQHGWKYGVGRVNEHMFKQKLFPPSMNSVVFLCGPPAMIDHTCIPNLEKLGYTEDNMFEF